MTQENQKLLQKSSKEISERLEHLEKLQKADKNFYEKENLFEEKGFLRKAKEHIENLIKFYKEH